MPAAAYSRETSQQVYEVLTDRTGHVLAAGHAAIVDAVFAESPERDAIAGQARKAGARFRGLFLTADVATRLARVGRRTGDASDADAAIALAQERYDLGTLDWDRIDASGAPEETLQQAQKLIAALD